MAGNERHFEYRKLLTNVISFYSMSGMARFKDIVLGLGQQTSRKCKELATDREELNRLRDNYQRYRELMQQVESKERSVKIGFALLASAPTDLTKKDKTASLTDKALDMFGDSEIVLNESDIDVSKYSLWRVIREVVRQTGEVRVFELVEHLNAFGVKASRPAVESALVTHAKEFRVIKRGREKHVALKGA